MYRLKKIGKVFTSKFVATGPSSYKKRIYRAAVSQRLRNTALGAINGKHAVLQCQRKSANEYFDCKTTFSIVLFFFVDDNYNFVCVDAGCQGRIQDNGVFYEHRTV